MSIQRNAVDAVRVALQLCQQFVDWRRYVCRKEEGACGAYSGHPVERSMLGERVRGWRYLIGEAVIDAERLMLSMTIH